MVVDRPRIVAYAMGRPLTVFELHSSFSYAGGGQRALVTFAKHMDTELFRPVCIAYREDGAQRQVLEAAGIEAVFAPSADEVLRLIAERKPVILHIHRSGGPVPIETEIILGAKRIDPNIIVIEKNVFGLYDPSTEGVIDCSLFQSMMHIHERYLPASGKRFDFDTMKVFHNPIDIDYLEGFHASPEEIAAYKAKLGIAPDEFVLGKIARPHIAKWGDLIVEMLPYLARLVPRFKFIVVGIPDSRMRSLRSSPYADHLILRKSIDDEREERLFYQVIDVLAHSSKIGECNGNTINEAMFWSKPVVTNSTPRRDNGQLEQVAHNETGFIANHPQTFARALAALHADPDLRVRLGLRGREEIVRENAAPLMTRRLEKCFFEVLARRGMPIGRDIAERYGAIPYFPNEGAVAAYPALYAERLALDFGRVVLGESFRNLFRVPGRLYLKVRDFIEARG